MRTRSPLALAAAAALAFGAVACETEGEVDGLDDVTAEHDTGADPDADPGLDTTDEQVTEDDEPVDDPAGADDEG